MKMTEEKVIEELVDEHIDYILLNNPAPADYLFQLLTNGFKGYLNMTNSELAVEYKEMFGEDIQVE